MTFWFHSNQELRRLWELVGGTKHYSHDAENVSGRSVGETTEWSSIRKVAAVGRPLRVIRALAVVKSQGRSLCGTRPSDG